MPRQDPYQAGVATFLRQKMYFTLFLMDFLFGIGGYISVREGIDRGFGAPSTNFVGKGGQSSPIWLGVLAYSVLMIALAFGIDVLWRAERKKT